MVREDAIEAVVLPACDKCGRTFGITCKRSNAQRSLCTDCAKGAREDAQLAKRDNEGWLELAMEQGIPLWEQQPNESNSEFALWQTYMGLWPSVRPTISKVSQASGVPTSTVQRAYNKWTWSARLQAWIREVTAERTADLRNARRKMVDDHVRMGELMRQKAIEAIEYFDPGDVTPNELVSILKETQRLESTARDMLDDVERATANDIDSFSPVDAPAGLFADGAAVEGLPGASPRAGLNEAGMLEVVDILAKAGVLKGVAVQTNVALAVDDEM